MVNVVGYARVSTRERNLDSQEQEQEQEQELRAAGALRIFVDRGDSSSITDRSQ